MAGVGRLTFDGVGASGDLDDRTAAEVVGEQGGVDGGRHQDQPQVRVLAHLYR